MSVLLKSAAEDISAVTRENQLILNLPMLDRTMARFRVEHSVVVEPVITSVAGTKSVLVAGFES